MSTTFDRHPDPAARPAPVVTTSSTIESARWLVPADEVHAGDLVVYGGVWHEVTRVDRGDGWAWPVASDGAGWAMALGHDLIALHRTIA